MSLLTATITATVFALFGFPFRHYQCWFSFSRLGTAGGMAIYLALAGGGGGALGWGLGMLTSAEPTASAALDGVLYGITGALALRADFSNRPRAGGTAPEQLRDARSILSSSIRWTSALLDDITLHRAEAWLSSLSDAELVSAALRIQGYIAAQPPGVVSDRAKNEMFTKLVPPMEQLNDPDERAAGRAHLITFCARYHQVEHLPRTPRVDGRSAQYSTS